MTADAFARVFDHPDLDPAPDRRWRAAHRLAAGQAVSKRYLDDGYTRLAVRVIGGDGHPELAAVRAAVGVYQGGGRTRRLVEAYLLTELPDEVIARLALANPTFAEDLFTPAENRIGTAAAGAGKSASSTWDVWSGQGAAGVRAFTAVFFAVRGDDLMSRMARAGADCTADRLRQAAVRLGPLGLAAVAAWEAGAAVPDELAERFERAELMDRLWAGERYPAYQAAVARLRQIEAGRPPGGCTGGSSNRSLMNTWLVWSVRPAAGCGERAGAGGGGDLRPRRTRPAGMTTVRGRGTGMPWEVRGTRRYYYQPVRVDGRGGPTAVRGTSLGCTSCSPTSSGGSGWNGRRRPGRMRRRWPS